MLRPPVDIGRLSRIARSRAVNRFLRVARVPAALMLPWAVSYVLVLLTQDADDCTEFPLWIGTVAAVLYGLVAGGFLLARKRPAMTALLVTVITAAVLALSWNALVANLIGAIPRGKQMRTVVDLGSASRRVEQFLREKGRPPASLSEAGVVRLKDHWGREFEYAVRGDSYALRSAAACGNVERDDLFGYSTGWTTRYSDDIVIVDGEFVAWPVGRQPATAR